jgi:predicted lipoprotein
MKLYTKFFNHKMESAMKNIIKFGAITMTVAALASCSTFGDDTKPANNDGVANDTQTVQVDPNAVNTDSSTPVAKVSLKQDGDQLKATIHTTYNNNPNGSVKLQWKAPEGTKCYDTSFPITKYGEKNDMTWATVQLKQGKYECKGDWTANVEFDGNIIATDTLSVS